MTRSSQPVPNSMHNVLSDCRDPFVPPCFKYYAQCTVPENDDRVACSIFFSHDVFTSGDLREFPGQDEVTLCQQRIISCPSEIQGVRVAMGRHEQLLPWAVTSNCCHGPSRATAAMGRHERFRSELAAGFEAQKKKCQPGRRRAFECLDRRQDVSLVEYGHSHGELHRAIKGREEASSVASPEEKALASEPAPVAPRIPSSSSVAFFLTTEDQTSAGNCGPRCGT